MTGRAAASLQPWKANHAMPDQTSRECRYFVSYSGVRLPFNLINSIAAEALSNRNTFIRGYFNKSGTITGFDKIVYGEVELSHRYEYYDNGRLRRAEIIMLDEEPVSLSFDEKGSQVFEPAMASNGPDRV
jgi:uncharacterized protein DUF6156